MSKIYYLLIVILLSTNNNKSAQLKIIKPKNHYLSKKYAQQIPNEVVINDILPIVITKKISKSKNLYELVKLICDFSTFNKNCLNLVNTFKKTNLYKKQIKKLLAKYISEHSKKAPNIKFVDLTREP